MPVDELWAELLRIGGDNGWHSYPFLWRARDLLDRVLGGPGMRRRRRHPTRLRVGDPLDFWRVRVERERRLTLLAEMRMPGRAVLEFELEPPGDMRSRLTTTARFNPAGTLGLLYWYALLPLHPRIFDGMTRIIAERAESAARARSESPPAIRMNAS